MASEKRLRDWVAQLDPSSSMRDTAIEDLRWILVRGLHKALVGRKVDRSFCEDMAQEALLKVLIQRGQFSGGSQFTTWAMAIAVRTAISELRCRRFQDVSLEELSGKPA